MPVTVTWDDGKSPRTITQWTIPDDVEDSCNQYRLQVTKISGTDLVVIYPDLKSMAIGTLMSGIVLPALDKFPTAEIIAAKTAAAEALANVQAVVLAALPGFEGNDV